MSWATRVAVVAGTAGDLRHLERTLVMLADTHKLRRVVPVGEGVADARALLRDRQRRFPEERTWPDPEYADFVLHAVLEGVAETPSSDEEVSRSRRLRALLSEVDGDAEPPQRVTLGGVTVAFVRSGATPPPGVALWVSAVPSPAALVRPRGEPPCLRPGRIGSGRNAGEPPVCAVVSAEAEGLVVTLINADGEVVSTEKV